MKKFKIVISIVSMVAAVMWFGMCSSSVLAHPPYTGPPQEVPDEGNLQAYATHFYFSYGGLDRAGELLSERFIKSLTKEERVITLTILGEARGEGKLGMHAVACVIKQRSINRKMTAMEICLQRKQFSCWNGKGVSVLLLNTQPALYAARIARHIASGGDLKRSYMKGADHYCTLRTSPYWAKNHKPVATIGNHKFFKLR